MLSKEKIMSCTQAMVLGSTSHKGNMNAQNGDETAGERFWEHNLVKLVIPEKGYRYLCHERSIELPTYDIPTLNEKGVSTTETGKFSHEFPPYPGKAEYLYLGDLLRTCGSAREYVEKWEENFTRYGYISNVGRTIVDPQEGYYIEGINFAYGDTRNHAVHGPMTDQVFAAGNFLVTERFKQYELGIGCGYNRAKRVWQLLIDRQYDCAVNSIAVTYDGSFESESGITLSYFMNVWKDHGNISPEEQSKSSYVPEERGALTVCSHGATHRTAKCFLSVSVKQYTNLLSCMWFTFGQPCISPFLPFYIGINEVPQIASTRANPLARVFEDLRLALEYHPEYMADINRYFTVFEQQTIEQSKELENDVKQLNDNGKETEARAQLTEFVARKCDEALSIGSEWLKFLKSCTINTEKVDRGKSASPGSEKSSKGPIE
jgi:dipeptidase